MVEQVVELFDEARYDFLMAVLEDTDVNIPKELKSVERIDAIEKHIRKLGYATVYHPMGDMTVFIFITDMRKDRVIAGGEMKVKVQPKEDFSIGISVTIGVFTDELIQEVNKEYEKFMKQQGGNKNANVRLH